MKKRLDMLMMERALAPSREKAKAYIMAGDVYVDGQKEDKAGTLSSALALITMIGTFDQLRTRRITSTPSMSGSPKSSKIMSGL